VLHISDSHHASLNQRLVPNLIQLAHVDDICGQSGDEVNTGECLVLPIFVVEQDCTYPFDLHYRAIPKLDRAMDVVVKI
jgi:hypothetical protein